MPSGWPVLVLLLLAVMSPALSAKAPPSGWKLDVAERLLDGVAAIRETVWSLARPPHGNFDRIRVHRYRGGGKPFAAVLYLPGTNMHGGASIRDERHNLWLHLAARGVDVYTVDYRTHAIPADTPRDGLGELQRWDTALFVDDVAAAFELARRESGQRRLFVGGFSRGALLAYAYALQAPRRIAGLLILDGSFKRATPDPAFDREAALHKQHESGQWASDIGGSRGWAARQQLMAAVIADPTAKSPSPDHATVGDLLIHVLNTAWGPGGLANPAGGLSRPQVLATLLHDYDRYYPAIQEVEGRSIAAQVDDPATPLDDRWGRLRMPIIAFASTGLGNDWTQAVLHSAKSSGSREVTTNVLDRYGHLDVLVGEQAREAVFVPTLDWLCAKSGRGRACRLDGAEPRRE